MDSNLFWTFSSVKTLAVKVFLVTPVEGRCEKPLPSKGTDTWDPVKGNAGKSSTETYRKGGDAC